MEGLSIQLRLIRSNIKILLLPVGIIVAVLALFIFLAPVVYGQITDNLTAIKDANNRSEQLEDKILSLRQIQNDILPKSANTVLALPDQNPILYKWSVVRGYTRSLEGVVLIEISSSTNPALSSLSDEIESVSLSTEIENANMDQIMNLVQEAVETVPYTTINGFAFSNERDTLEYEIIFSVYWSQLPVVISRITEPVDSLQASELALLDLVSSLRMPEFTQLDPTSYPNRFNPFQ